MCIGQVAAAGAGAVVPGMDSYRGTERWGRWAVGYRRHFVAGSSTAGVLMVVGWCAAGRYYKWVPASCQCGLVRSVCACAGM